MTPQERSEVLTLIYRMTEAAMIWVDEYGAWKCVGCKGEGGKCCGVNERERAAANFDHYPGCVFNQFDPVANKANWPECLFEDREGRKA
mgnify:CR=1 FL=1